MNRRVTMKDVAAEAGVSGSTVCRALRSDPRIPAKTRRRVQAAAEKLGYRPDPLISAFASRRRGKTSDITTIAYITNFPTATGWRSNGFYLSCYEGACARAQQMGYRVEHFWLKEPGMTGRRLSRVLSSRGISTVCIAPTPRVRGHLPLDWSQFASVTIGYSMLLPALHRATPHHFHGILVTIRELKKMGYKRIGLAMFTATSKRVDNLWLAGMMVDRAFERNLSLPIYLCDDRTVSEVGRWCKDERLEVVIGGEPEIRAQLDGVDVDYVSVVWNESDPDTPGINQRPRLVGATAIDVVIAQQQRSERGVPEVPLTTMVEPEWMPGRGLRKFRPG